MCHMCKCHVIHYLFVCSVPSWGPHAGCRQTQFKASYLLSYHMCSLWDSVSAVGPFTRCAFMYDYHTVEHSEGSVSVFVSKIG